MGPVSEDSNDVTAAILVFQKNVTEAILVFQTNPVGDRLFSYVNKNFQKAILTGQPIFLGEGVAAHLGH